MTDFTAIANTLFEKYDEDKSGTITQEEATPFFNELVAKLGLAADEFNEWFLTIDVDESGTITPDELAAYLEKINFSL